MQVIEAHRPVPDDVGSRPAEIPGLERLIELAVWFAVVAVALQSASHLVDAFVFDGAHKKLNADEDFGIWAWASSAVQAVAAFVLLLTGLLRATARLRIWAVAAVLAFFSADDLLRIHEEVGSYVRGDLLGLETGWGRVVWPIVFAPLLGLVLIVLVQLALERGGTPGRTILAGLGLLVGAVLVEAASAALYLNDVSRGSWPGALEIVVEEGAELAGWILIAAGLTVLLGELAARATVRPGGDPR